MWCCDLWEVIRHWVSFPSCQITILWMGRTAQRPTYCFIIWRTRTINTLDSLGMRLGIQLSQTVVVTAKHNKKRLCCIIGFYPLRWTISLHILPRCINQVKVTWLQALPSCACDVIWSQGLDSRESGNGVVELTPPIHSFWRNCEQNSVVLMCHPLL